MKRILPLLLSAVLLMSMLCVGTVALTIHADGASAVSRAVSGTAPTFAVSRASAMAGQTVTVDLRVVNNPGIVALRANVTYDPAVLAPIEMVEQDFVGATFGPLTNNPLTAIWVDAINPDVTTDGVVARITFAVSADAAAGEYPLLVGITDPEDIYNANEETVTFAMTHGAVAVVDYVPGDANMDGKVNVRDLGCLQQYLNGWGVEIHLDASDVNGDGKVNVRDLGRIQQHLNGWDVTLEYAGGAIGTTTAPTATTGGGAVATTTYSTRTTTYSSQTTRTTRTTSVPTQTTRPAGGSSIEDVLAQVPDSLSGTRVKMMIWWTQQEIDEEKAAAFKEATGIEVQYVSQSFDKYQSLLSAMIMSQNSPSIAAITNEWYPQPITRGLMQPVSNVSGWNFKDENTYSLSLMDQFGYKGEHYGIAVKGSTNCTFHVMFFNKNILRKCGVKQDPYTLWKAGNWNWDTCLQIAQQCTNPSNGLYGISNIGQYYWMLSAGQDFVKSTKAGLKNNMKSAELLDTWNWAWDLIYTHKVVDTSYTGQIPFYQGKAAMLGAGSYIMQANTSSNYVPQNMAEGSWGVVPFPSPAGMTVSACDGTVWGFPVRVSGNQLQAAAWYLRYYLDDYNNPLVREDFYPNDECWEVMRYMWDQTIQSYNSVGVLTYGGEHDAYTIQYSLVDEAATKAHLKSNLDTWYSILDSNIAKIENELG